MDLKTRISRSREHILDRFGYEHCLSRLVTYSDEQWTEFMMKNKLKLCDGVYDVDSFTAFINSGSRNFTINMFHEFFGHGLYTELGKGDSTFSECYAVWIEYYLAQQFNIKDQWFKRFNEYPLEYQDIFKFVKESIDQFGDHVFSWRMGMPKNYNNDVLVNALRKLYKDKFPQIKMVLLHGSKLPMSDIDLTVIGTQEGNYYDGVFDIYNLSMEEFLYRLKMFDISVTSPLFTGSLVIGDETFKQQLMQHVIGRPITQEAIEYNESLLQKLKDDYSRFDDRQKRVAHGYMTSTRHNIIQLRQGRRILTR